MVQINQVIQALPLIIAVIAVINGAVASIGSLLGARPWAPIQFVGHLFSAFAGNVAPMIAAVKALFPGKDGVAK